MVTAVLRATFAMFALCSLMLAVCAPTHAQAAVASSGHTPPRVVFVCEHGSVKSLVAMMHFNHRAQERGLKIRAIARGAVPDVSVPETVRTGLLADGFDVSAFRPQAFKASDLNYASLVVSFDQDVANIVGSKTRYLKWDNLPGVLADYPKGRDAILTHIDELIDELARTETP